MTPGQKTIVQKATTYNDPLTVKYTLPLMYEYGQPTPVKIQFKYNAKTKYHYSGIKKRQAPTYSKVFRKNSLKVQNIQLVERYTAGSISEDMKERENLGGSMFQYNKVRKSLSIRPNKSRTVTTLISLDRCYSWPSLPPTDSGRRMFKNLTGFESPPSDYPCVSAGIGVAFDRSISGRGYKSINDKRKGKPKYKWTDKEQDIFGLDISRIKISRPGEQ